MRAGGEQRTESISVPDKLIEATAIRTLANEGDFQQGRGMIRNEGR